MIHDDCVLGWAGSAQQKGRKRAHQSWTAVISHQSFRLPHKSTQIITHLLRIHHALIACFCPPSVGYADPLQEHKYRPKTRDTYSKPSCSRPALSEGREAGTDFSDPGLHLYQRIHNFVTIIAIERGFRTGTGQQGGLKSDQNQS
jgi:hypothetical protein